MTIITGRTRVTEDFIVFYLSPDGSDGSNTGLTSGSPIRTHHELVRRWMNDWDFAGKSVVTSHVLGTVSAPAVYDDITMHGKPVGSGNSNVASVNSGDLQFHFAGDPDNLGRALIRPTPGRRAIWLSGGATLYVNGFKTDMLNSQSHDMATIEVDSRLVWGKNIVGYQNGHFDFQVCIRGKLGLLQDYVIDKGTSIGIGHIQQDQDSLVYAAGDGKFGYLNVTVVGSPAYSDSFLSVDRATCNLLGAAWLASGSVNTAMHPNSGYTGSGSSHIQIADVANIVAGQHVVAPFVRWGATVIQKLANNIVHISDPTTKSAIAGQAVTFGNKASATGCKRYRITNGGMIMSGTNLGDGPDMDWLPGEDAGTVDDFASFYI